MPGDAHAGLAVVVLTYLDGTPGAELVDILLEGGLNAAQVNVVQNSAVGRMVLASKDVTVLASDRNAGYAGGMNAGISRCLAMGASQILLMTHDARPRLGCVEELAAALDAHPDYGILAPVLRSADERLPFSAGGSLDDWGMPAHDMELTGVKDGIRSVDWVDGSMMLVRSDVFKSVGLLDERFFMYCDDVEICLRARGSGWRVGVVAAAEAHQSTGISRRPGAFAYLNTRNGLEVARRARGSRAVARNLGRLGRTCWDLGRRSFAPNVPEDDRRAARIDLRATLEGMTHFAVRRWGPPPAGLPGLGDVTVGRGQRAPR